MDAMTAALDKIRARTGSPVVGADSDRQTYAAFPTDLKAAMRAAASGYGWSRDDWRLHIQCCHDALLRGVGSDVLADGYRNPHPSCLEYRLKPPETAIEATK